MKKRTRLPCDNAQDTKNRSRTREPNGGTWQAFSEEETSVPCTQAGPTRALMGRSKDFGQGSTNPQAETLEKNKDQGVDAHEQREETKEKGKGHFKERSGQDFKKERRFSGREAGRSVACERGDRRKAGRGLRGIQEGN